MDIFKTKVDHREGKAWKYRHVSSRQLSEYWEDTVEEDYGAPGTIIPVVVID